MKNTFRLYCTFFCTLFCILTIPSAPARAADSGSATQTISEDGKTSTWTNLSYTVGTSSSYGANGLYFVATSQKDISSDGSKVSIKAGCALYVQVPSTGAQGSLTIIASDNNERVLTLPSNNTIKMAKDPGATVSFTSTDIMNINNGYYIKLSNNGTEDFKFTQISVTLTSGVYRKKSKYCISVYNSSYNRMEYFYESANSGEYVIEDFVVPDKDGDNWPMCWVGENDAFQSYSADWTMANIIPLTSNNDIKSGLAAGAVGTLHIWEGGNTNKNLQFSPKGYGLCWGIGTGDWNANNYKEFYQKDSYQWETELLSITSEQKSWNYYVGYKKNDGFVFAGEYWVNDIQKSNSKELVVSSIYLLNANDDVVTSSTINNLPDNQHGKFEIYDNSGDNNWYCHFVPYYRVAYDEQGGSEVEDGEYYAINAGTQSITLPTTTRDGYVFKGWSYENNTYTSTYPFNPTADITLTAVWEKVYTVTYDLNGGNGTAPIQEALRNGEQFPSLLRMISPKRATPLRGGTMVQQLTNRAKRTP